MALATHQLKASSERVHFSSWRPTLPSGRKIGNYLPPIYPTRKKDLAISLKLRSSSSVGSSRTFGPEQKSFKISAFKGGNRHDDSSGRANGLTHFQRKSEEASAGTSMAQNAVPVPYPAPDESISRSQAIQQLFKKWLILLRTPSETQPVESSPELSSTIEETLETPKPVERNESGQVLKAIWCSFMGLDAVIKVPLLVFIPMYSAINLIYGSEVSKELAPLWILGPLVLAAYIRAVQAICRLYAFCFRQTVQLFKNLPAYFMLGFDYIISGRLKEAIQKHLWQPVASLGDKEVVMKRLKELQEWLLDKYLDFVESIWPYYCRAIRFLKRANLI